MRPRPPAPTAWVIAIRTADEAGPHAALRQADDLLTAAHTEDGARGADGRNHFLISDKRPRQTPTWRSFRWRDAQPPPRRALRWNVVCTSSSSPTMCRSMMRSA